MDAFQREFAALRKEGASTTAAVLEAKKRVVETRAPDSK
jgi:hypothetical protein